MVIGWQNKVIKNKDAKEGNRDERSRLLRKRPTTEEVKPPFQVVTSDHVASMPPPQHWNIFLLEGGRAEAKGILTDDIRLPFSLGEKRKLRAACGSGITATKGIWMGATSTAPVAIHLEICLAGL